MGILYALSLAISVGLIVHVFKTGRNFLWITVLIFLPIAGAIAYFIVEILPELRNSRTAQRTIRGVRNTLDPTRDLRRAEDLARVSGDVASKQRYADELLRDGRATEAVEVYKECLTGLFATDPKLLEGMARAQFEARDPLGARTTLDNLIASNPDYKSADGHLLYARSLAAEGNVAKAIEEYAVIASYYPGAEATVRYAELLAAHGRRDDSERVLRDLLDRAKVAPNHYRKAQAHWLNQAEQNLRR